MNEKIPTPQELKEKQDRKDADRLADYLIRHPNLEPLSPSLVEQTRTEFDSLVASFEAKYSLEQLHSIIDLTPQEAPNHPLREPARVALIPIVKLLNDLKAIYGETSSEYQSLKEKHLRFSRAVGMINKNKVDHNR